MQLGLLFEKWLSKKQLDIVKDDCLVNDADRLTRVAAIYYGHGIYNVALEHLTNALKINHLFIGNGIDHKDIADNLYNIGLVYLNLKDYKKALQYHQEALQIRQRIFERDKNHQDITKSLEVCSTINSIMGIEENIKKLAKTFTFNEIKDLQNSEDEMNEEQEDEIWDNPTGKGTSDSSKESYWFEYSGVGVNSILKLRLAGIKNVEILRELIWDETTKFSIKQFIRSIIEINKEGSKIVLPINIYGKHWASLVIDGNIAYYLDSENHSIPTQMKEALIDLKLEVFEVETEQQYYNNCGVEMIENIVFVLTGERVTQEKAIFLHSMLFERHLHNSNSILKKTEKIIREYIENRANKITYLKDVVLKKDYKLVLVDEYGNQFEVQNLQSENKNKENIFALGYKLVLKANYVNYTIKKSIDMGDIDEKLKAQAEYYLRTGRLFDSARNANISNIVQEEVTYGESFTELSHFNSYTYEDLIAGLTNYFLNNVVVSTI